MNSRERKPSSMILESIKDTENIDQISRLIEEESLYLGEDDSVLTTNQPTGSINSV